MMEDSFPSKQEQELVRKYVMERPLIRPHITYFRAFLLFFICGVLAIIISNSLYFLLEIFGLSINKIFFFSLYYIILFLIFARRIGIICIQLYQHYAKEEVRRRCLLKPTCSEFAIIVIKKYGLLIGGIKTWIRLNYKCRGNVYYIDEP